MDGTALPAVAVVVRRQTVYTARATLIHARSTNTEASASRKGECEVIHPVRPPHSRGRRRRDPFGVWRKSGAKRERALGLSVVLVCITDPLRATFSSARFAPAATEKLTQRNATQRECRALSVKRGERRRSDYVPLAHFWATFWRYSHFSLLLLLMCFTFVVLLCCVVRDTRGLHFLDLAVEGAICVWKDVSSTLDEDDDV